ncbi:Uma2 family endonuclease [Stratiformator vulcanicus]|uniref:Putative restriction endonuclease domain-containing protein n=1 Tax=Stratiformator vulcanicus TaxID=2527980 RepID=A0A517R6X7_9PLAN|nr:Uma2 family endonuclease [Stratiformator vulcanicus]QDT39629.1 hypothetical protein Pan189_40380 [Stratiformator vulcanicus]
MATAPTKLITVDEFEQMSFEGPCDLVDGEIVEQPMPGGIHGGVCVNIAFLLKLWVRDAAEEFWIGSNDVYILIETDPDRVRGADVMAIRKSRIEGGRLPLGTLRVPPDLCVEVTSPTDRWTGIHEKVAEYIRIGVKEVWVADVSERQVHVYRENRAPFILTIGDELRSDEVLPGFTCPVEEIFAGV